MSSGQMKSWTPKTDGKRLYTPDRKPYNQKTIVFHSKPKVEVTLSPVTLSINYPAPTVKEMRQIRLTQGQTECAQLGCTEIVHAKPAELIFPYSIQPYHLCKKCAMVGYMVATCANGDVFIYNHQVGSSRSYSYTPVC